jgi:hypothetical protein
MRIRTLLDNALPDLISWKYFKTTKKRTGPKPAGDVSLSPEVSGGIKDTGGSSFYGQNTTGVALGNPGPQDMSTASMSSPTGGTL